MIYFAYGSNMLTARLRARTPGARPLGTARLPGHSLRFHKRGMDGSGKCDAFFTGDANDVVLGVVYAVPLAELPVLDAAEGLGRGYRHATVSVEMPTGTQIALTYVAMPGFTADDLPPFGWYRELVRAGAAEHGLSPGYVAAFIDAVAAIPDPDAGRDRLERLALR